MHSGARLEGTDFECLTKFNMCHGLTWVSSLELSASSPNLQCDRVWSKEVTQVK